MQQYWHLALFLFIHFRDGNGRLHRFLIHYALSQCGFTLKEVVFPVSVVILREPRGMIRRWKSSQNL